MKIFPHVTQRDAMDCGPACLKMICESYGKKYNLETLRDKSYLTREGVSLLGISDAAESLGFRTLGSKITYKQLYKKAPKPCIIHWNKNHFVVVYKITKAHVSIADPANKKTTFSKEEFLAHWAYIDREKEKMGIVLLLEPTPIFFLNDDEKSTSTDFKFLSKYITPHKRFIFQLILSLITGSVIQLIFPFLTQAIIDIGISSQNKNFLVLILFAQIFLIASRISIDFIRSWILLHISARINVSLISDFLIKLMKLPANFFDKKHTGDIIQRIEDHGRIEEFITSQSLNFIFSILNIIMFSIVLVYFSINIFLIFFIGSLLYIGWVSIFMRHRKTLDHRRFAESSNEQNNMIQLIEGMQEIKLSNSEKEKRWEWEHIQAKIFRINISNLKINQLQLLGGHFFNEIKNIFIIIYSAFEVINGSFTLGTMLAIQYTIGQLHTPIESILSFFQSLQDAKLSFERLGEIHGKKDEFNKNEILLKNIHENESIALDEISFQYDGPRSPTILENVSLSIPEKKITAIVGASGTGKTTLMKLLIGLHQPITGKINIGNINLTNYDPRWWRSQCGVVMQDGFIFSATLAHNISVSTESIDIDQLFYAIKIANLYDFIETLPLGINTKIGHDGVGISQGQKQRILIARAVYKNPRYLFLDEATNALDSQNEKTIIENFNAFFEGKTAVVIAHRLSTIKHADQIVVLHKGKVSQIGTHNELIKSKGIYYNLVLNQL